MALVHAGVRCFQNVHRVSYAFTRCTTKGSRLPAHIEHSSTMERKELLARGAGNDDPFSMSILKKGLGTKKDPNIIYSIEDKRIVGCICEEDSLTINWMWVHLDDPKKCECGYWFKLDKVGPL